MESQRANQKANPPRDRCQSVSDVSSSQRAHGRSPGPINFEAFRNCSAPNLADMLTGREGSRPLVKPVPKPRTVFNRRRTAPVHFCATTDAPPPSRRLSQDSIFFSVSEGATSGDTPTSDHSFTSKSTASQAERRKPGRSLSLSDARGSLPPVPPRLNRGVSSAKFQGSPSSSSSSSSSPVRTEQIQTHPVTFSSGSLDDSQLSESPGSPRGGGMEMVSNEIYWGTSPGSTAPVAGRSYYGQQSAPPTPPRQTPERNR